ncbi:zinc finger protein [Theobroma cacao]|nr:zinc finger protein [Theobroma cacao]
MTPLDFKMLAISLLLGIREFLYCRFQQGLTCPFGVLVEGDAHDDITCARCGGMHTMTPAMCTMWGDAHDDSSYMHDRESLGLEEGYIGLVLAIAKINLAVARNSQIWRQLGPRSSCPRMLAFLVGVSALTDLMTSPRLPRPLGVEVRGLLVVSSGASCSPIRLETNKNGLGPTHPRALIPTLSLGVAPPLRVALSSFDGGNKRFIYTQQKRYSTSSGVTLAKELTREMTKLPLIHVIASTARYGSIEDEKPKVTAIREAKDLNVITLDEICGSLLTHELELKEEEKEDKREAKEKKKSIAFKASILEEELEELSCDDDDELALVARKFRKIMGRRNRRLAKKGFKKDQGTSWKIRNKNDSNKKEELICYECKKPGHFKSECPLLKDETPKKNKKSKKAMVASTWSDSDTSSSEAEDEKSEERANLCLMAQDDEIEVELHLKETCSRAQLKKKQPWYMDSGCLRHMIGDEMLFAQLDKRKGGTVSFDDDSKGQIHGIVNIAAYILNRVSTRPMISKTPYELYKGRKPNISHLRSFGCKCFVLNNGKQPLVKFDAKSDEAIFLGYALNSKAYRAFNKRTLNVEESIHVVFDESNALQKEIHVDDDDIEIIEKQIEEMSLENNKNNEESSPRRKDETESLEDLHRVENQHNDLPRSWRFVRDHPQDQIIGDISQGVRTRRVTRETCEFSAFISQIEPKNFEEAEKEES